MSLFAPHGSDPADDSCPYWVAGCGMLVAGGFCYRMLLDESCIARESQNAPAPARASDRLLSIQGFLSPRRLGPRDARWMLSAPARHQIRQHQELEQLADRVFVDPREQDGVGGLLWSGLGSMRGSEQIGP